MNHEQNFVIDYLRGVSQNIVVKISYDSFR